ncbi:MAG: M50 family metallopeptidase [Acidobacteria bacterium]|nr:M50 family metallopeptidase [Acidobacteriota bacterium]
MLHLGSIRGTSIDVDFTFFVLIGFFVLSNYSVEPTPAHALLWIPILFLSVLIHELAHAAAIGLFGYGESQIVLGGMGGVTMNARRAESWHDMIISGVGPLSSYAIYWVALLVYNRYDVHDPMLAALLPRLSWANLLWAKFNILPIPPLDGGSVLRNFLNLFLKDKTSFVITTWVGMLTAAGLILYFLLQRNFFLAMMIAWFLISNWQKWEYFREHGYPGD